MKLTEKQLIEFCAAQPNQIEDGEFLLTRKLGDHSWIKEGLRLGHFQSMVTKIDGVPRYLVIWHLNDQKFMMINAAALVGPANPTENFSGLLPAMLDFARGTPGCQGVDCVTLRPGLAKLLLAQGWKPEGIYFSISV